MGGYLPNAPVNEAAHQFIEKKCSEGKHDKGYMTIPFTTQSWFDPAPGPDPVGSLLQKLFPQAGKSGASPAAADRDLRQGLV